MLINKAPEAEPGIEAARPTTSRLLASVLQVSFPGSTSGALPFGGEQ
jgi:hypothetical protein